MEFNGISYSDNPLLARSLAITEAKGVEADVKKMGYNGLSITWKTEAKTGRLGAALLNKNTNKWEIQLDPSHLTLGLVSHELGHSLFYIKMMDKPTKKATIKKLLKLTKDIELTKNLTLFKALKDVSVKSFENIDLAKAQESELFSYISQFIRDGAKIKETNNNSWHRLRRWIKGELSVKAKNNIINWFKKYHQNISKGDSNLSHFDKLAELIEKMTPYGKIAKTTAFGVISEKPLTSTKNI